MTETGPNVSPLLYQTVSVTMQCSVLSAATSTAAPPPSPLSPTSQYRGDTGETGEAQQIQMGWAACILNSGSIKANLPLYFIIIIIIITILCK